MQVSVPVPWSCPKSLLPLLCWRQGSFGLTGILSLMHVCFSGPCLGAFKPDLQGGCVFSRALFIQDICDFIPASLSISDVTGISELQPLCCSTAMQTACNTESLPLQSIVVRDALLYMKHLCVFMDRLDTFEGTTFAVPFLSAALSTPTSTCCAWCGHVASSRMFGSLVPSNTR